MPAPDKKGDKNTAGALKCYPLVAAFASQRSNAQVEMNRLDDTPRPIVVFRLQLHSSQELSIEGHHNRADGHQQRAHGRGK